MKYAITQLFKKILKRLAVVVLLLMAGLIVFLLNFDINEHKATIQNIVNAKLHREIEIAGDMTLGLSLQPTIVLNKIHIRNPEWASRHYFASADEVQLELELLPLLRGLFYATSVNIHGADIQLESSDDGRQNWQFRSGESARTDITLPGVEEVHIYNSLITRLEHDKTVKSLNIKQASLSAALDEGFEIEINGRYENMPVELNISTAVIDFDKDKWPVEMDLLISDNALSFSGVLHKDVATKGLSGKLRTYGTNINALLPLMGMHALDIDAYDLSTQISISTEELKAENVKLEVGLNNKRRLSVSDGDFIFGKTVPMALHLYGNYAKKSYEVSASGGTFEEIKSTKQAWPVRISVQSANNQLKLDGSLSSIFEKNIIDLALQAKGDNLIVYESLFDVQLPGGGDYSLDARINGQDKKYTLSITKAMFNGTNVKGGLQFDFSPARPKLVAELTANHIPLDDYFQDTMDKGSIVKQWMDNPISIDMPKAVDVDFNIKVDSMTARQLTVEKVHANGKLADGRLLLSPLSWRMAGIKFSAKAGMLIKNEIPSLDLHIGSKHISGDLINKNLGLKIDKKSSLSNVNLSFLSSGGSLRSLLTNANLQMSAAKAKIILPYDEKFYTLDFGRLLIESAKDGSLSLVANGDINNSPLTMIIHTDTLANLIDNINPLPVSMNASLVDAKLSINGAIRDVVKLRGVDLHIRMKGGSLARLKPLIGFEVKESAPYAISTHLSDKNDIYTFDDISAEIGNSDVSGYISVSYNKKRPYFKSKLRSNKFQYFDLVKKTSPAGEVDDARVIPKLKLPASLLKSVDAEIDIQSVRFFVGDVEYNNTTMHSRLNHGVLNIKPLTTSLEGGTLVLTLKVDARNDTPLVFFELDGRNIDYGELIETMGLTDKINGKGDVFISLDGQGQDTRALFAAANGTAYIVSEQATINQPRLELWAADLVTTALSNAWKVENVTNVNCIVGRTDVLDGIVKTDSLLLDTERITIAGSGGINLATEEMNFLITPAPKNPSFVSLATPVRLTGTLSDPQVNKEQLSHSWLLGGVLAGLANPGTLLFMYSSLGTQEQNPCLEAVKQRELKEQQAVKEGRSAPKWLPGKLLEFILKPLDSLTAPENAN